MLHYIILYEYIIYLLQLNFHPVAVVGKLVQKIVNRQLHTDGETIHKTIQKHRTQNRKQT